MRSLILRLTDTHDNKGKDHRECLRPANSPCGDAKHDEGAQTLDEVRDQSHYSERMAVEAGHFLLLSTFV